MRRLALAGLAWLATTSVASASDETGRPAYHFLNLGTGPRLEALGEAGSSLGDGADALDWNPARLTASRGPSASAAWFNWLQDVQGGHIAGVLPLAGGRAIGLTARSLSVGQFDNVDDEAAVDQSDVSIGVGFASPLIERLSGGAGVKLVRSSLADESATGWAVDAGLDYLWVPGWNLVGALRNFGPAFGYGDGAADQLPTQGRLGVGGRIKAFRFGVEGVWENGPGVGGVAGAEYHLFDRLALRAGSRLDSASERAVEPWSVGLGFEARPGWSVDYSFRDGRLEPSHRVGLRWSGRTGASEAPNETARSRREFYVDMLNGSLEKSLAGMPGKAGDSVVVRAAKAHEAAEVVAEAIAEHLRARGFRAAARPPVPAIPESLAALQAKQLEQAGLGAVVDVPVLEVDIRASTYEILSTQRERWIGPRSEERRAAIEFGLSWKAPGEAAPSWTSSGTGSLVEEVRSERIPGSAGYPPPASRVGGGRNPFVEPAIVSGIVAGLAVIFFSNRDVGN